MCLKDSCSSILANEQHGIRITAATISRTIHSWGPHRHAGHRKADGDRALLQQPLDVSCRYVALNGVAVDLSRVATPELFGNAQLGSHRSIARVLDPGLEAVGFEVGDPILAAPAFGTFPNFDPSLLGA